MVRSGQWPVRRRRSPFCNGTEAVQAELGNNSSGFGDWVLILKSDGWGLRRDCGRRSDPDAGRGRSVKEMHRASSGDPPACSAVRDDVDTIGADLVHEDRNLGLFRSGNVATTAP
jgi:hypothetical protein